MFIKKYITSRPLLLNILIGLLFIVVIGLLFSTSLNWITQHGVARTVPSVKGKKLDEVRAMLEEKGFELVIQDSVYYDSLPPTVIIKQIPEGDAVVKVNRTIYVTINRVLPPDVDMPNLIGYSFRNAEMILKNLSLRLGDTTFKTDFAKNSVLEQTLNGTRIPPGAKVKVGSKISLVLGTGVGNTDMPVPLLLGMMYDSVKIFMDERGLIIGAVITDPLVRDPATAYVYKQSPEHRNEDDRQFRIRTGQTIDIWLGLEKPNVDSLERARRNAIWQRKKEQEQEQEQEDDIEQ
ncbi:MAG: PASTA domain-containing protein [Chitinophagaceae bacterium]